MKKNVSQDYIDILKLLDDDDFFVMLFYFIPFSMLDLVCPKGYLVDRVKYLKKVGKL